MGGRDGEGPRGRRWAAIPEQGRAEYRPQAGRSLDGHRVLELFLGDRFEVSDMYGAPVIHGTPGHGATTDGKAPPDRDGASQRSMLGHVAKEPAVDEIEVAVARIAQ